MPTIRSYPEPSAIDDSSVVLADVGGLTVALPISMIVAYLAAQLADGGNLGSGDALIFDAYDPTADNTGTAAGSSTSALLAAILENAPDESTVDPSFKGLVRSGEFVKVMPGA